jgi:hypothetical protein
VIGCYSIEAGTQEGALTAPVPPTGITLTDRPFLADDATADQVALHRFDARAANQGFLVYADTALAVAWWWEDRAAFRFGVGNHNRYAAFYVSATVSGDRLDGEFRRWRYPDGGGAAGAEGRVVVPLEGEASACSP